MATPKKKKEFFDFRTIKTFKDACEKTGTDPKNLPDVSKLPRHQKALQAIYKLFIIFEAINDGWTPDWFNTGQYKYFPWLQVKASKSLSSGFGFSRSSYLCSSALTFVGSRLCTDSSEKALYIAEQFQDEYKDFMLISK